MTVTSRTSHPGEGLAPGITVRRALPAELTAAGAVVRLAYEADGRDDDYLDVVADAEDRSRDAEIAVAVDDTGEVIGCVTFVLPGSRWAELSEPGDAEFRMLGVHPAARGRGIGRALTSWCIDQARSTGARRILLCSLPSMEAAHRLYGALGFRRRPELDRTPEPGLLLLGFELPLARDLGTEPTGGTTPAASPISS
jgi:ribosomal protein S18 acetylase RimI-like enzyme